MSIYIKGIDIPQDGIVRVIMIESDGSVRIYGGSSVIARAIEVPPHGALKDIGAIPKSAWRGEKDDLIDAIILAPTIIPADREDAE